MKVLTGNQCEPVFPCPLRTSGLSVSVRFASCEIIVYVSRPEKNTSCFLFVQIWETRRQKHKLMWSAVTPPQAD